MNQFDTAERLARRALALREKHQGPDDPATATVLNTLAYVYFRKKEYDKAEPILGAGPGHPGEGRGTQSKRVCLDRTLHIKALRLMGPASFRMT